MCRIAVSLWQYRPNVAHFGVPCGALWLHSEAVYDCSCFSVLTRMVSDAFLAILAFCGACFLCCIFHGLGVLAAGHRCPALCTALGDRAERYPFSPRAICVSLVGLMYLIHVLIVVHRYVRLYWYVPHRRVASAISATFQALLGTLRRPLAPQRGVA
jgi:hypothetical protein